MSENEEVITLPYRYRPRVYQRDVWSYMMQTKPGLRGSVMWHRRAGKDLTSLNIAVIKSQERVGSYWHIFPTYLQGRNIIWDGTTAEGMKFLDYIPPAIRDGKNETRMQIKLTNGSIYQIVGTDNLNSLVGTNPVGCIFSEFSLHDPAAWDYIRPILAENGGWALFIFTPRGENFAYKQHMMAMENEGWFAQTLKAGDGVDATKREDGRPVISDAMINEERLAGMPEAIIQQEFYCDPKAAMLGAYYGEQMKWLEAEGRITSVNWEPNLAVDTYWDLGMDDSTSIWFVQTYGNERRVIDYYENTGEGLAHYANVLSGKNDQFKHMREYTYGRHYAPHDIEVREIGPGISRKETARGLGIKFQTVTRTDLLDGIEACRNILMTCWFDKVKCKRGIEALKTYRKEQNVKMGIFSDRPVHDWSSHAADAFRTFAMSYKTHGKRSPKGRMVAQDDYDYVSGNAL